MCGKGIANRPVTLFVAAKLYGTEHLRSGQVRSSQLTIKFIDIYNFL
jgi:hypothetical protein